MFAIYFHFIIISFYSIPFGISSGPSPTDSCSLSHLSFTIFVSSKFNSWACFDSRSFNSWARSLARSSLARSSRRRIVICSCSTRYRAVSCFSFSISIAFLQCSLIAVWKNCCCATVGSSSQSSVHPLFSFLILVPFRLVSSPYTNHPGIDRHATIPKCWLWLYYTRITSTTRTTTISIWKYRNKNKHYKNMQQVIPISFVDHHY